MIAWLLSEFAPYIGGAVALLAAFFGARATWRREGAQEAKKDAKEADTARAQEIKENANEARTNDNGLPPDDRLHKHGKLRD